MNLQKSIDMALALRNQRRADLARQMGVTGAGVSEMIKRNSTSTRRLSKIADALDMKTSELIALGED